MTVQWYELKVERIVDGQLIRYRRTLRPEGLGGELMTETAAPGTLVRLAVEAKVKA